MLMSLPRRQSLYEANGYVNPKQINAYDKFMAGHDTAEIASFYKVHEQTALRWISLERSRRHERENPYEVA